MMINTNAIVSASEANQNFSRVARIADAQGQADDEKIDVIAARILKKFKPAFEELAK